MHNTFDKEKDMPAGLKMALTQNLDALNRFTDLSENGQFAFISQSRHIRSKQEMQSYVNTLLQG